VNFTIGSTTGPARTGTLTVAGQTFTVNQASGCSFSLSSTLLDNVPSTGGSGSVNVTASNAACTWTATTTDNFLNITSGASGTGNGTVTFTVGNNGGGARTGHLTIAGITFTVNQQKH
jgi:hypothetical protein